MTAIATILDNQTTILAETRPSDNDSNSDRVHFSDIRASNATDTAVMMTTDPPAVSGRKGEGYDECSGSDRDSGQHPTVCSKTTTTNTTVTATIDTVQRCPEGGHDGYCNNG